MSPLKVKKGNNEGSKNIQLELELRKVGLVLHIWLPYTWNPFLL